MSWLQNTDVGFSALRRLKIPHAATKIRRSQINKYFFKTRNRYIEINLTNYLNVFYKESYEVLRKMKEDLSKGKIIFLNWKIQYYKDIVCLLCQQRSIWSRLWLFQWSCMDVRVGL